MTEDKPVAPSILAQLNYALGMLVFWLVIIAVVCAIVWAIGAISDVSTVSSCTDVYSCAK